MNGHRSRFELMASFAVMLLVAAACGEAPEAVSSPPLLNECFDNPECDNSDTGGSDGGGNSGGGPPADPEVAISINGPGRFDSNYRAQLVATAIPGGYYYWLRRICWAAGGGCTDFELFAQGYGAAAVNLVGNAATQHVEIVVQMGKIYEPPTYSTGRAQKVVVGTFDPYSTGAPFSCGTSPNWYPFTGKKYDGRGTYIGMGNYVRNSCTGAKIWEPTPP